MKLPEKCPKCGSIFIQADPCGAMKIIKCLVRDCNWRIIVDSDEITKKQIRKIQNIYLRTTL